MGFCLKPSGPTDSKYFCGSTSASWIAYITPNGVIWGGAVDGSNQAGASVTWNETVTSPAGSAASAGAAAAATASAASRTTRARVAYAFMGGPPGAAVRYHDFFVGGQFGPGGAAPGRAPLDSAPEPAIVRNNRDQARLGHLGHPRRRNS